MRECGITVAIDGSEDHDINIRGLVNYQVQLPVTTSDMDTSDPILIATRMSPLPASTGEQRSMSVFKT